MMAYRILSWSLLLGLYAFAASHKAHSHDWYSQACCGGHDCHPVPCEEMLERDDGGVSWDGHVFPKEVVQPSKDNKCHVCIGSMYLGGNQMTVNRCAFVLQGT